MDGNARNTCICHTFGCYHETCKYWVILCKNFENCFILLQVPIINLVLWNVLTCLFVFFQNSVSKPNAITANVINIYDANTGCYLDGMMWWYSWGFHTSLNEEDGAEGTLNYNDVPLHAKILHKKWVHILWT
jgi:hypothetical protein